MLCPSLPDTIYQVVIIVYHSEYLEIETISQHFEAFDIEFPKVKESTNVEFRDPFKLITATTNDYLTHLSDLVCTPPPVIFIMSKCA